MNDPAQLALTFLHKIEELGLSEAEAEFATEGVKALQEYLIPETTHLPHERRKLVLEFIVFQLQLVLEHGKEPLNDPPPGSN